ncbi:MAG: phosphoribosyltransferase family protein [Candidatus Fimenecus sp.]
MFYTLNVAGLQRNLPLCKVTDDLYIGAFIVFGDPELTTACAEHMLKKAPEYDYVITAEAKGIPLAHEMARLDGNRKYFVARKKPKLYMTGVFETTVKSITTEGEQKLYLDVADAELMKGKKILIVDDVVTTGESIAAVEKLVNEAGGIVCGRMCVLAEGGAADRDDLIFLEKLPVFNPDGTIK